MNTTFAPPLSGIVLSHVIDAFGLRRWDTTVGLSSRNASRFFAGERIGEDGEHKVWVAAAESILAADLLPGNVSLASAVALKEVAENLSAIPPQQLLARLLATVAHHWDETAGALRRLSAPVGYQRLAAGACLRLVVIDVAVRLTGLLWRMRSERQEPLPTHWAEEKGVALWLRELHGRCVPSLTRDQLADALKVHAKTVDAWFDSDTRPSDENLEDLADLLSRRGVGDRGDLLRDLRLAYGMRHLFGIVQSRIGQRQATDLVVRLALLPAWMLMLPRASRNPGQVDLKMRIALTMGTLGRGQAEAPFIESMLNHVWRNEADPVWRTSIKAATRSWLEHLQEVTTKLPPSLVGEMRAIYGSVPTEDEQEHHAYVTLASKAELGSNPLMRAAMDSEAAQGGYFGALELKLRACEASNRGDLLGAIDLLRAAVRDDPGNAEIHFRLGACLWQIGDVDAGLLELEISVQLDPGWDRSQVEVAILLLNLGREEEALRRLEASKPLLRGPSLWHMLHVAHANDRVGNTKRAVEVYEELIALDPENAEALDRLAHLYFVLGEKRKGAELAKRAHHLGFSDVFDAWKSGYYSGKAPKARPPQTTPIHLVHLGDRSWPKRGKPGG